MLNDLRIYNPSASFLGTSLYTREALNLNRLSIPRRGEWSISLLQREKVPRNEADEEIILKLNVRSGQLFYRIISCMMLSSSTTLWSPFSAGEG